MPPPNDAPVFSTEICTIEYDRNALRVSDLLADLLSDAREQYVWGAKDASESQEIIVRLESETVSRLTDLHADNAQRIIHEVSRWAETTKRPFGQSPPHHLSRSIRSPS